MRPLNGLPHTHAPHGHLVPLGHFIVRTPLLGFEEFAAWGARPGQAGCSLSEGVPGGRPSVYRERLGCLLNLPLVRDAVFLASRTLSRDVEVWQNAPDSSHGMKVERALVKYVSRMVGKPTPLGLMGGYSLGRLGEETELKLEAPHAYVRRSRLSYEYLHQLAAALAKSPELEAEIPLFPNTSLHTTAGYIRYVRAATSKGKRRYEWMALEDNEYIQHLLLRAQQGATPQELAESLVKQEVGPAEAREFVRELVALELLVPALTPPLTALNGLEWLEETLARTTSGKSFSRRLRLVREALAEIDRPIANHGPTGHDRILSLLEPFPVAPDPRRLMQVDLLKPGRSLQLGADVLAELKRGIALLHHLGAFPVPVSLQSFRHAFVQRFGTREIPLLEALDPELGVFFDPMHGTDEFAGAVDESTAEWLRATKAREDYWLGRLTDALWRGLSELELTEAEAWALPSSSTAPPVPSLMTVVAAVAARSEEEFREGHFRIRIDYVNPGERLLSRAAHIFPELREELRTALSHGVREAAGRIPAELVHLPQGAVGDIVAREALHEMEIVFLGQPAALSDRQLPVSDLRLSVVGKRIILRSARMGHEVIPKLSTAHDYFGRNLTVYQFLATLQHQDSTQAMIFSPGRMKQARFVPRIVSGRLVLSVARWTVWKEDLLSLAAQGTGASSLIDGLRMQLRLPRFLYLEEGDDPLLMDLDNPLCADLLLQAIQRAPHMTLTEVFPSPEELSVTDGDGRHFSHELFVPFMTTPPTPPAACVTVPPGAALTRARVYPPGSDWLYLKLYAAPLLLDRILNCLAPVIERCRASGVIDYWFFVRYADPEWHLRVRFHGEASRLRAEVLPLIDEVIAELLESGRLWKLQYDTYERELERYGGSAGLAWVERLFCHDSEFALAACALTEDSGENSPRWWMALRSTHELLVALGFELGERWEITKALRDEAVGHMPEGQDWPTGFSLRYREFRADVEQVLQPGEAGKWIEQALLEHLHVRFQRLQPQVEMARREGDTQGWNLRELTGSCVHMHLNRLLTRDVKAREACIYDFLSRYYGSALARQRGSRKS